MAGVCGRGRTAALLLIASGCVVSQPAAAEPSPDAPVTVVWPEMTRFNPDTNPYRIDVSYEGEETLYLWYRVNDTTAVIPSNGTYEVPFLPVFERNGSQILSILKCPASGVTWACTEAEVARSPRLEVYSDAVPNLPWNGNEVGPTDTLPFSIRPVGDSWTVEWEVVPVGDQTAPPLVSGVVEMSSLSPRLPAIGMSPALVTGERYIYRARVSGDVEPFGPLVGADATSFLWDAEGPRFTLGVGHRTPYPDSRFVEDDIFYPVEDDYLDSVGIVVWADGHEIVRGSVVVSDASGFEVFRDVGADATPSFEWDGRDPAGQVLPEGNYRISMTAFDNHDNATTKRKTIALSHGPYVDSQWRRTFAAADLMTGGRVGACGRVKQPARRAWPGSVGLYTSDTCRPRRQRFATTTHRVDVPISPDDTVRSATLTIGGAKARREQRSSLWIRLRDRSVDRWLPWIEVPGQPGQFEIPVTAGVPSADDTGLVWEARVRGGDSYDLRNFTVELHYSTPVDHSSIE